jgi:hypothetical protein
MRGLFLKSRHREREYSPLSEWGIGTKVSGREIFQMGKVDRLG